MKGNASTKLSLRLDPMTSYKCRTLRDHLGTTATQVVKRALAHYHEFMFTPNVGQTSDTLTRAHGMNTFFKYKEYIPPPCYKGASAPEEEEEDNYSNNTNTSPSGFDAWWDAMPLFKGFRPGKQDCIKKWRLGNLEAKAGEIIAATKRLKKSKSWLDGFNPMPINFLRHEKWLEAPPEEEDFFIAQ